jgi:hypothetical protein
MLPIPGTSKVARFSGRKGRSRPDRKSFRRDRQAPQDAIRDAESAAGFGDAKPGIAGGKAIAGDRIEELLAVRAVGFFRGQMGRKRGEFLQSYSKQACAALFA